MRRPPIPIKIFYRHSRSWGHPPRQLSTQSHWGPDCPAASSARNRRNAGPATTRATLLPAGSCKGLRETLRQGLASMRPTQYNQLPISAVVVGAGLDVSIGSRKTRRGCERAM